VTLWGKNTQPRSNSILRNSHALKRSIVANRPGEGGSNVSATGSAAFDNTLQTTNIWLNDVMDQMGWQDKRRAYHALRAVLHALRDHLSVYQAAAFGAQLPMLVRGFFYEGWHPEGKPVMERWKEEFLAHIAMAFQDDRVHSAENVACAVLHVVTKHVSPGVISHMKTTLPSEIRSLWPEKTIVAR
jgi:uncharacterized protein (DUF2267 family)